MTTLFADKIAANAKNAYEAGEFLNAASLFEQAASQFSTQGDELMTAEMHNNSSVAFLKGGNPRRALDAAVGSDQTFAAAGDVRRQAMALGNIAAAQEELHDFEAARENYSRSAELFKEIGERDLRATVLEHLSALQFRTGKRIEALFSMETAIESKNKLAAKDCLLKSLIGIVRKLAYQDRS